MEIIIDNNILFSFMNLNSIASKILAFSELRFIAPSFIKSELEKYKEECRIKSGLSEKDFESRKKEVESKIIFYNVEIYKKFLKKAIKLIPDPDDVPYLALALSKNFPIWSNDPHLKKQSIIEVFTTKELISLIHF